MEMKHIYKNILNGVSSERLNPTWGESGAALQNMLKYRTANVSATASFISITTASSSFSIFVVWTRRILPIDSNWKYSYID